MNQTNHSKPNSNIKIIAVAFYFLAFLVTGILLLLLGSRSWQEWYRFLPIIAFSMLFFFIMGWRVLRSSIRRQNLALLATIVIVIICGDRLIWLNYSAFNIWEFDVALHYKQRSHAKNIWWSKKPISINSYGHHDDEFPVKKKENEIRGLMIGDSITMGHEVSLDETFSNTLERMLQKHYGESREVQIINTGVQGYSTFQELEVLKRSMKFEPDFIVVGFCMNDVTESYRGQIDEKGDAYDYHLVQRFKNPVIGWLLNETGYAKFMKSMRGKLRSRMTVEEAIGSKRQRVLYMFNHPEDPMIQMRWEEATADIGKMASIAQMNDIPMLLVVFPDVAQLYNPPYHYPSKILRNAASEHGIDFMDFTQLWKKYVVNRLTITPYFIDNDHYTQRGHEVVADHLFDWVKQQEFF